MPFVQGQLREDSPTFAVETECAICRRPLHLEMDSELDYHVGEEGTALFIFVPLIDFGKLEDPSIIDAF